jgi:RNA polymerase sigma factor (TIGR02999 family)
MHPRTQAAAATIIDVRPAPRDILKLLAMALPPNAGSHQAGGPFVPKESPPILDHTVRYLDRITRGIDLTHGTERRDDITGLLEAARLGDRTALDHLFPLVYDELRELARGQRRRWHGDLTMNATALVHEAYVKLMDQDDIPSASRGHFFAVAARVMRHVLCNYARDRRRLKRGGAEPHVTIDADLRTPDIGSPDTDDLIALDAALVRLEEINPRHARIVECRFFAGLTVEEAAAALELSPATVKRDWALAKAWLFRAIKADERAAQPIRG